MFALGYVNNLSNFLKMEVNSVNDISMHDIINIQVLCMRLLNVYFNES